MTVIGWNSNGVGKKRNFVLREILLVSHGGSRHDTICTCETKEYFEKGKKCED